MKRVYRLPLTGDLVAFGICSFMRLTMVPAMWLGGYRRLAFGRCVFWAPKDAFETIVSGIEFLRAHDDKLLIRLTTKQKLVFRYTQDVGVRVANLFPFHEKYIRWGKEGVAALLVQSLFRYEAAPSINPFRLSIAENAANKNAPRKALEWMIEHSVSPVFIDAYREVVDEYSKGWASDFSHGV